MVPNNGTGDVGPRLVKGPSLTAADFAVPDGGVAAFDHDLTESTAESQFVQWAASRSPGSVRWLVAQPSLDRLISAAGEGDRNAPPPAGDRRCDFLYAPLGMDPVVIEVDGLQHAEQRAVDRSRDRRLGSVGIKTIRVPTDELAVGEGLGLDEAARLLECAPRALSAAWAPLVWAPVQAHRLVLGLC